MAAGIPFVREIELEYGAVDRLSPLIRRVVARNPGPFTFHGTGTYILGTGEVAVIDPGPLVDEHIDALVAAVAGETVTHIVITHTHQDHSPAAAPFQEATGAPTYGFGPHVPGRCWADNDSLVSRGDMAFIWTPPGGKGRFGVSGGQVAVLYPACLRRICACWP